MVKFNVINQCQNLHFGLVRPWGGFWTWVTQRYMNIKFSRINIDLYSLEKNLEQQKKKKKKKKKKTRRASGHAGKSKQIVGIPGNLVNKSPNVVCCHRLC